MHVRHRLSSRSSLYLLQVYNTNFASYSQSQLHRVTFTPTTQRLCFKIKKPILTTHSRENPTRIELDVYPISNLQHNIEASLFRKSRGNTVKNLITRYCRLNHPDKHCSNLTTFKGISIRFQKLPIKRISCLSPTAFYSQFLMIFFSHFFCP